uniref:Glutaredoxin domain-containing protein n=1 Tax=Brassica oleracea var. oleracea TaxID=109376 RepID=A0A0D3B2T5_BRAOL
MWRPWRKSSVKIHNTFSPTASFKDIHHLCTTDDSSSFPSSPCASPSSSPNHVSRVFHRVCAANLILRSWPTRPSNNLLRADSEPIRRNPEPDPKQSKPEPDAIRISIPGAESSIVVYFTSLRVVRPTFVPCKACRAVTAILRSFLVRIDERDLSMDASFAAELDRIFGSGDKDFPKTPKLPRVFIGGRYVGGAEEVKQLHEIGELKKLVQELPRVEPCVCETCGGHRFVPCNACHGSHKVHTEKLGFSTCSACNENGLVRCSSCSFPHLTPDS